MAYKYTSCDGMTRLAKYGRLKKVYFTTKGKPYIMYLGGRLYFDDIMRLNTPILYEDENGRIGIIGGYYPISAFGGHLVEVMEDGEHVQMWNEWDLSTMAE